MNSSSHSSSLRSNKSSFLRTRCAIGPGSPSGLQVTPAGQNTHPPPRYRSVNHLIPCVTCVTESSRGEKPAQSGGGGSPQVPAGSGDAPPPAAAAARAQGVLLRPHAPHRQQAESDHPKRGVEVRRTRPLRSEPGRAALSSARRCVQIPIAAPEERLPPPSELRAGRPEVRGGEGREGGRRRGGRVSFLT